MPDGAFVGRGTAVASSAVIATDVTIGENCDIGPNCVIYGGVTIGDRTILAPGCVVGAPSRPGRLRTSSSAGTVDVGSDVFLLEHVVVNAPLEGRTRVGDRTSVGPFSLVAHDCDVGEDVIVAPHCALGGYSSLGDRVNLGLGVRLHPRLAVGALAMCGMGAVITKNVAPGVTVLGAPARLAGLNRHGLLRAGFTEAQITEWRDGLEQGRLPAPDGSLGQCVIAFRRQVARSGRAKSAIPDYPWILG